MAFLFAQSVYDCREIYNNNRPTLLLESHQ